MKINEKVKYGNIKRKSESNYRGRLGHGIGEDIRENTLTFIWTRRQTPV
jgi:hypothetical protein